MHGKPMVFLALGVILLAALRAGSQGPSPEDRLLQELGKAKGKGPPSAEEKMWKKMFEPPRDEFDQLAKDMKKAFDKQGKPPPGEAEQFIKEMKKAFEAEIRAGFPAAGQEGRLAWLQGLFRLMDRNGNGLLENDELSEALRGERQRWDANRDGVIDLNEYADFFQARLSLVLKERADADPDFRIEPPARQEEPPARPAVFRAGRLPRDLPAWFAQLDTDQDGQVGLYEWKSSSRSLDEFRSLDRNDDGFLTVEEVLRWTAQAKVGSSTTLAASVEPARVEKKEKGKGKK